jgi:uncharacterized protein (DUF1810 family)
MAGAGGPCAAGEATNRPFIGHSGAMSEDDPHDLARFVEAQDGVYDRAVGELRAGRKRTHWIWFILPQLEGLGRSPTAKRYGIASREEARAYLEHPILGPRLLGAVAAAMQAQGAPDAHALFGSPDDLKFRSCLTLFAEVAEDPAPFEAALDRFYGGERDPDTLRLLGGSGRT